MRNVEGLMLQEKPGSTWHVEEQPSEFKMFESSQASFPEMTESPHTVEHFEYPSFVSRVH